MNRCCLWQKKTEQPCRENLIGVGQFTKIHNLGKGVIRKVPSDKANFYNTRAIEIEYSVYKHLGKHKRVARCIAWGDDFVDLQFEPHGDLENFLKKTQLPDFIKYRMIHQTIEAVIYIHGRHVIHSDLSARQLLVGKRLNIRLSDFGGSSLQGSAAIVMENTSHFLPRDEDSPNTVQSDLFALGSTMYEILLGKSPYDGIPEDEIQRLFATKSFPSLDNIQSPQWRCVILNCWSCKYHCASEIFDDIPLVSRLENTITSFKTFAFSTCMRL
ncbi:kinase-like protein [Penicillium verhagenii]|nr:kinase-like protein [Penicillium verhagenii]